MDAMIPIGRGPAIDRINEAVKVAEQYGVYDGEHHKQWVIDQMLRKLLGFDGYHKWLAEFNADEDYEDWDEGIPP